MSVKLKIFLITYDRLIDRAIEKLTETEKENIVCYTVQKNIPKNIVDGVLIVNEWELFWNDYTYQQKQYYEYGSFVHLLNNEYLIEGLTHIGILHYDIIFKENSISNIIDYIEDKNKIFYNKIRYYNELYLTPFELFNICEFLNKRLNVNINYEFILNNGWISECLSVVPIEIFKNFAKFIQEYRTDIENILLNNMWGIMNVIPHRMCGIIERMWGIYLVSSGMELKQFDIIHDWNYYKHKHQEEKNIINNGKYN